MRGQNASRGRRALACRSLALAAAAWLCQTGLPAAAPQRSALTSPPINYDLYKPEAIQRSNAVFGSWTVSCDEIVPIRRRYCSLSSEVTDGTGRIVALLTVSTGDDGKPAALIHLPIGVAVRQGASIDMYVRPALKNGKPAAETKYTRSLPVALCSSKGCDVVWQLSGTELSALNGNSRLVLRYQRAETVPPGIAALAAVPRRDIEGAILPDGFGAAVQASLR